MSAAREQPTPAEMADLTPGADNFGHLLWETSVRWMALAEPQLSDTQLSFPSIGVLGRISAFPGITASTLAREGFKTQQALSQVTGRLERLGYVERRVGAGRGVGLYITKAGERALAEGMGIEDSLELKARELLGEELYTDLKDCLRQARAAFTEAAD
jgi:DNA-binding MarR family transcriptional regulator